MKTLELREFHRRLSELNNSFTHYTFVWKQFALDYSEKLKESPDFLTKDYFTDNAYSKKHNIKFSELDKEHTKTHNTLIQGIFLLMYSNFEGYLKDILLFANNVDSTIKFLEDSLDKIDKDYLLIDKVINRIKVDKSNLNSILFVTLDYIRLKRNRLIHSNSENISNSLNDLINIEGKKINDYWNEQLPSKLQGLDFTSKDVANSLSFNIIIDLINILRGISNKTDMVVIETLSRDMILRNIIIPNFKKATKNRINGLKQDKVISKFIKYCQTNYSLSITDDQVKYLYAV